MEPVMIAKLTVGALLAGLAFPAYADTNHTTIMGCYASVHSQCYGNGSNNCSDDDYQWGLDNCDGAYGNTNASGHRPGRLVAPGNTDVGTFVSPRRR